MRLRTWLVAALGLGSLVALIAASMLASSRRVDDIYSEIDRLNTHHRRVEGRLRALRSDVYLSSIYVRDYLLDGTRERAPEYRQQLAEFRSTTHATLAELRILLGSGNQVAGLENGLDAYWTAFEPLFDWSPAEKLQLSAAFLRREVVPRREAVLGIAGQIEALNDANLLAQSAEAGLRREALSTDLNRLLWQTMLLGLVVALIVVARLWVLERRSDRAEDQMRELSQRLVRTQEEERKDLSRELHDHVAQVLTGLRMELGRIDRMGTSTDAKIGPAVVECKKLVDDMFRTVRGLALGLRPSMLDDFGLQAALEWLARDITARFGVTVDLRMDGVFDALPDRHRTCVYRVVQEALTNCVRHAHAQQVQVRVATDEGDLHVTVTDNGVGLDPTRRRDGLGLRGIEERVKELGGTMAIARQPIAGTSLTVRVPMPPRLPEMTLARAAG